MTATKSNKLQAGEKDPRKIVAAINGLVEGRTDNYAQVTLAAGATETVVSNEAAWHCSPNSTIVLSPRSENAAAALATTWIKAKGNRTFTIGHASNAQTDRIFDVAFIG